MFVQRKDKLREPVAVFFDGTNYDEVREVLALSENDFYEIEPEDRVDDLNAVAEIYNPKHSVWGGVRPEEWIVHERDGIFDIYSDSSFCTVFDHIAAKNETYTVLADVISDHIGIQVFERQLFCACGFRLWHPDTGFGMGEVLQRMGQSIGEAAFAHHLAEVLSQHMEWVN